MTAMHSVQLCAAVLAAHLRALDDFCCGACSAHGVPNKHAAQAARLAALGPLRAVRLHVKSTGSVLRSQPALL